MTTNKIFEDLPSRREIPAAAPRAQKPQRPGAGRDDGPDSEQKRIRQAVYDIRYRARREEIPLAQAFSQYMQNASLNGAEKIAVRKKLFEEYEISNMISDNIATAMYKVFVEGFEKTDEEYLEELKAHFNKYGGLSKKYKVRVTDKDGRSYVRFATREKIQQLRANPNIKEVEMTEYGTPYEGERKKGEQTAAALAGKDYDGDKKIESPAKEYRGVVHNAIQRKRGGKPDGQDTSSVKEELVGNQKEIDANNNNKIDAGDFKLLRAKKNKNVKEDFIDEKIETTKDGKKKITGKGVNNKKLITVYPTLGNPQHMQTEEIVQEKAVSTAQQKFFGMVHAYQKGMMKNPSKEVKKAAETITDTEAEKFASTKHKGLPDHVKRESLELDEAGMPIIVIKKKASEKSDPNMTSDLKKINSDDPRSEFAKDNLMKNKMRAMGAKNVMTVGEELNPSLKKIEATAKENVAKRAAAAQADKQQRDANTAAFQAHKKDVLAKGGRPVDALDSWQKKKLNKEEVESLDELNRLEREQGKQSGGTSDPAVRMIKQKIRKMEGKPAGQRKKVPGQKPPAAGEYGSGKRSPAQEVAMRRRQRQQSQDNMSSRFD